MKKILTFTLVIVSIAIHAQKNKQASNPTIVSGQFTPAPKGFFLLQHHGQSDTVKVAQDGTFSLKIEQPDANYYTISTGKQSMTIYLLPMDDFKMVLNGNMLSNNPSFTGTSAPYCYYLLRQKQNDKTNAQFGKYAAMDPNVFRTQNDSIQKVMLTLIDLESKKNDFISPFVSAERKAIEYYAANNSLLYKYQFEEAAKTGLPEDIEKSAFSGDLNDESMRFHDAWTSYASNLVNYRVNGKYDIDADKSYVRYCELKVEEVCNSIKSQANRDAVFQPVMNQVLQEAGAQDIRRVITKFEACCTDERLKSRVRKSVAQYTALYPGEQAPDAVCYDTTGKVTKLSDLRGKVIYIDTWATWCGPCKREIPELKKLEAEYHGKNIEFISVSTDQNLDAWKKFIAKQEMTGTQLHQSDNIDESMSKLYMVNSIPRFIIIDEAGKIVSADAPRPSSGDQVRQVLNQTLND